MKLNCSFVLARKKGKLPLSSISADDDLEYGKDSLEIHSDSINRGDNVLIIHDLLATGGAANAAIELINTIGGNIHELAFLIELYGLNNLDSEFFYSIIKL